MADDKKIIFSMVGVSKIFPPQKQVLKNIYLSFFYGAKIGIIGLNGSGKSTLLKIIAGLDKDYQGEVVFSPGYSVGYLEQDPKLEPGKTVKEVVQEGVQEIVDLLKEYEAVNERFGDPEVLEDPDKMEALINRQAELQDKIDATDAWNLDSRLERAMDALRCPPEESNICSNMPVRSSALRTTATSSTMWRAGFWSWTVAKAFLGRGITPLGSTKRPNAWRKKRNRQANGAKPWSANWNGSAWRPKPVTPKAKPV